MEILTERTNQLMAGMGWSSGHRDFYQYLVMMGDTHHRKNQDYSAYHPLENFFRVALDVGISPEKVVEVFIATKSIRIQSLLSKGALPQNESIVDSYLDRAVYSLIGAVIHSMDDEAKRVAIDLINHKLTDVACGETDVDLF